MSGTGNRPQSIDGGFKSELMEADRRFAAEVQAAPLEKRAEVWAGWFEPEGCQVVPGQVVQGSESIIGLMGPAFAAEGYSLVWEPDLARSSQDGTLGLTSGRYTSTSPDGTVSHGRYASVWKRVDGQWRVTLDTGVPD